MCSSVVERYVDITRVRSNPSATAMIITHRGIRSNGEARMGLNKTRLPRFIESFLFLKDAFIKTKFQVFSSFSASNFSSK